MITVRGLRLVKCVLRLENPLQPRRKTFRFQDISNATAARRSGNGVAQDACV